MTATQPVWDDGRWTSLAPLAGDVTADTCVIGLGGAGLSALGTLADLGVHAVGLAAGRVADGAAGGNGGFLLAGLASFHHKVIEQVGRERASAIYLATLREMSRMAEETPDCVRRTGSLRIAESAEESADCDVQLAALRADGFAAEPFDGAEGRGLSFPGDCSLQPMARARILAARLVARGVALHEASAVTSIAPANDSGAGAATGVVVGTASGTVRCRTVIDATDGALALVLPELAARVTRTRLQMLATAPVDRDVARCPVYARWGYDYWQQLPDGRIAIGGARDADPGADNPNVVEPTMEVQRLLERRLRESLRVSEPVTHRWAAAVSYSSNGLPIAEEVRPRVWALGAYNGTGNVVGPLLGRAVAVIVASTLRPVTATEAARTVALFTSA